MRRVWSGINTTSCESQHWLSKVGEWRIAQACGENDVVPSGTNRCAWRNRRIQDIEHFLGRLFVTLLRKADVGDQQHRENCETESVVGFHNALLRKQWRNFVECYRKLKRLELSTVESACQPNSGSCFISRLLIDETRAGA